MKMHVLFPLSIFAAALVHSIAFAEKAPLSVDQLKSHADAIVVAMIEGIRIESEPSRFERGFRNRSRRSFMEYLTPSGHHPIPETRTLVRAYLKKEGNTWGVVLPNGITSVSDVNDDGPVGNFEDATQVRQLRSLAYTFLLPLEIWMLLVVVGIPILLGSTVVVRRIRSRRGSMVTEPMED